MLIPDPNLPYCPACHRDFEDGEERVIVDAPDVLDALRMYHGDPLHPACVERKLDLHAKRQELIAQRQREHEAAMAQMGRIDGTLDDLAEALEGLEKAVREAS